MLWLRENSDWWVFLPSSSLVQSVKCYLLLVPNFVTSKGFRNLKKDFDCKVSNMSEVFVMRSMRLTFSSGVICLIMVVAIKLVNPEQSPTTNMWVWWALYSTQALQTMSLIWMKELHDDGCFNKDGRVGLMRVFSDVSRYIKYLTMKVMSNIIDGGVLKTEMIDLFVFD